MQVVSSTLLLISFYILEFLDDLQIKACNAYSKLDYEELPTLFLEFQGSKTEAKEQAEVIGRNRQTI